jgi:hypothetical protein
MSASAHPRFVYLIQAAVGNPYPDLASDEDREVIVLNWKEPSKDRNTLFYPNSSWNEGRNRLFFEAKTREQQRESDFLYYIFMDEDCIFEVDQPLARRLGLSIPDDPFKAFEAFLLKWEPAVGYPRYDWQYTQKDQEVNLGYNFDALVNAFHRDAAKTLLPYYTGFDAESWLYSQLLITHLCAMLYNEHRIQYNPVRAENRNRRSYDIRKKYWTIPTTFLLNGVVSDIGCRMRLERPNEAAPIEGRARKKEGSYTPEAVSFWRHFDPEHPFFKYRMLRDSDNAAPNGSHQGLSPLRPIKRTAVCMSGRCVAMPKLIDNIRENLLSVIGPYDLFMYLPREPESETAEAFFPTVLQVEPDLPIPEDPLVQGVNCRFKAGVQRYLQQLYGLKRANDLRLAHEHRHGVWYDRVIRCRPDLFFLSPPAWIDRLDLRYVHVPDFHGFEGVNDRFAVGSPEHMDVYMRQIDTIFTQASGWKAKNPEIEPVTAEMCTAGHLRHHGIEIRQARFRFNRVRPYGIIEDTTA